VDASTSHKFAVARTLRDIATLLELSSESPFKSRAYRRAATSIEALPEEELGRRLDEGRLMEIDGVGDKLARQIAEIWQTGRSSLAERLASQLPPGILQLAHVPGLTVRRIRALHDALGTSSLQDVKLACEKRRVRRVTGFGPKTEARILEGIRTYLTRQTHVRLAEATRLGEEIGAYLRSSAAFSDVRVAGALRRSLEVVDELVFMGASDDETRALEHFASYPAFALVAPDQRSARLSNGLTVRIEVANRADG
jgi:DNA polymerase (family 10)